VTREHPQLKIDSHIHPNAGGGPPSAALTPAQIRHIYSIDKINGSGAGQTIAIVDAYDDPNIFTDADVFDKQFMTTIGGATSLYNAYGASSTWLTKAFAQGAQPTKNAGWDLEISLDVEWMHAIAPMAKIILVETASNSFSDLLGGDTYAASHGATVVSNSWGGGESSSEVSNDSTFNHTGVTFVFSSGDNGVQEYPAESPNVVAVGGTTLSHDSNFNWTGETGWSGSGGGVSAYESKPGYQSSLSYTNRAAPDVSYDAGPNSGFAVYDSVRYQRQAGWFQVGGTSAGAPQWAGLLALANEGRAKLPTPKSTLSGITQTLPDIYALSSGTDGTEALYDVTSGSNSVGSAGPGFDLVTGLGSPRRSDLVFQALVSAS
jgi:subtilase family serine protease